MERIVAQKIATQDMISVTGKELKLLKDLNSFISIGEFDYANTDMNSEYVVGFIAGDIGVLTMFEEDIKLTDKSVHDCWFINAGFFNSNYKRVGTL